MKHIFLSDRDSGRIIHVAVFILFLMTGLFYGCPSLTAEDWSGVPSWSPYCALTGSIKDISVVEPGVNLVVGSCIRSTAMANYVSVYTMDDNGNKLSGPFYLGDDIYWSTSANDCFVEYDAVAEKYIFNFFGDVHNGFTWANFYRVYGDMSSYVKTEEGDNWDLFFKPAGEEFIDADSEYYAGRKLSNGTYLAVGWVKMPNALNKSANPLVVCYSSGGEVLWHRVLDGSEIGAFFGNIDKAVDCVEYDGAVYILIDTSSEGPGSEFDHHSYKIAKLDMAEGTYLDAKVFGDYGDNYPRKIFIYKGNFIVFGDANTNKIFINKISPDFIEMSGFPLIVFENSDRYTGRDACIKDEVIHMTGSVLFDAENQYRLFHMGINLEEKSLRYLSFVGTGEDIYYYGSTILMTADGVLVGGLRKDQSDFSNVLHDYFLSFLDLSLVDKPPVMTKLLGPDARLGFGHATSISGMFTLIGGYTRNTADIFQRQEDGLWNKISTLSNTDDVENSFGCSLSLAGDYALVGAQYDDDNGHQSGAAYIFSHQEDGTWIETAKLTATDGDNGDYFGNAVSLSGDYALIGACWSDDNGIDSGAAYIFQHQEDGSWIEITKLTATDNAEIDTFGRAVSLYGDYALVGANRDADNGQYSGSAYIFQHQEDGSWIEITKLTATDGGESDFFGSSVSLYGDYALVGAERDNNDSRYTSKRYGSAYIFQRQDDGSWKEMVKLTGTDGTENFFGSSVSLFGDYALVGAPGVLYGIGSAYIFKRDGDTWEEVVKLNAGPMNCHFGKAVSISESCALVGADYYDENGVNIGAVYIYHLSNCVAVDFNNDNVNDIALFSPAARKWYIKDQSEPTYGTNDCLPVPGDYTGDGATDLAVVDLTRSDGLAKWYLDGAGVFIYGLQEWIPVPGDYNGDGVTDVALFNPDTGKWYVRNQFVTTYGAGGIPVPGDYNGDGITDIAVFYPANNKWYIKDIGIYTYGMADCIPAPADYDGDGSTDLAVIDTSRPDGMAKWYIREQAVFIYGTVDNTIPVPGDYDGDGDADPCLFYQNFGKWYCRNVGIWSYGNGDMIPLTSNLATRYAISQAEGGSAVW